MNKVMLIGRVATDIDIKQTQGGHSVAQFRIAVNRRVVNQEGVREADFIPIVAWRQLADNVHKYLSKGRQCAVFGTLQTRTYDAQDGSKRYVTEVIADDIEFLGDKASGSAPQEKPAEKAAAPDGFVAVDDEPLPF